MQTSGSEGSWVDSPMYSNCKEFRLEDGVGV